MITQHHKQEEEKQKLIDIMKIFESGAAKDTREGKYHGRQHALKQEDNTIRNTTLRRQPVKKCDNESEREFCD